MDNFFLKKVKICTCAGVMKMVALEVVCWFLGIFFNFVVDSVGVHDPVCESWNIKSFVLELVDDDL